MIIDDKIMSALDMTNDSQFGSLLSDSQAIIEQARSAAYRSVNILLVQRNWLLGRRIVAEQLGGEDRAEYGKQIISSLADKLTAAYGDGFTAANLYYYIDFAKSFPELFHTENQANGILHTACGKSSDVILLCADTDEDVARYSSLHDDDQLYMAKYLTYMPTKEELRREIEQQKMVFALKSGK